jgi:hypothetical protein
MPPTAANDYERRILEQLLLLRAAGGFEPAETAPGRGVWQWTFRAGGWPVDVILDTHVLEVRVYHGRDEVAMGRVPEPAMNLLLGRVPVDTGGEKVPAPAEIVAELRRIISAWKEGNARIFIRPPAVVGHPDNWNRA